MTSEGLTRDELLSEVTRLADEIGAVPTVSDMNEDGRYSAAPYYREFGSWPEALSEAGLEPSSSRQQRSASELLAEICRLANKNDPPSKTEMDTHGAYAPGTYRLHFGSWNVAIRKAGFTPRTSGTRISDVDLCDALADLADELDTIPNSADMNEHGPYSAGTYNNRFGSWRDALVAAGLDPDARSHPPTDESLCDAIQQLASELGRPPSTRDMNEVGPYHATTYYRRFGSWSAALEHADIEPRDDSAPPSNKIDREALCAELRRLAASEDGDNPPTTTAMEKAGKYSARTYLNRFGSWSAALAEVGLDE